MQKTKCVCEVDNTRVMRMKCFPTPACLSWLLFPPDDPQVGVMQSCLHGSTASNALTGFGPRVHVNVLELFVLHRYRDVSRVTARPQGSTHTCGLSQMLMKHRNQVLLLTQVIVNREGSE